MGTIRADFYTHRDHWWDALILLPILRKLLLEILQEVGRVGVDSPCRTAPQGDVLHMRVPALHPDICWTVLRCDTSVQSAHSLRLAPKKGQAAGYRWEEARCRHFRT